jgi:hypothetical protein
LRIPGRSTSLYSAPRAGRIVDHSISPRRGAS